MSNYRITISHIDGNHVSLHPGSPEERDFVEEVVTRAVAKGLGMFKSESQIRLNLVEAMNDLILQMKREVRPI